MIEYVNIGEKPNDRTGDPPREAFRKVNNLIGETILIQSDMVYITEQVDINTDSYLELSSDLSVLETQVSENHVNITTHAEALVQLGASVDTITDEIDANASSILTLGSEITTISDYVDGVPARVESIASAFATLEADVNVLSDEFDASATSILNLQSDLNTVTQYVDGVPVRVDINASAIADLRADVNANTDRIDSSAQSILELESDIEVIESDVDQLEDGYGDVDEALGGALSRHVGSEEDIIAIFGDLDDIDSIVGSHSTAIANLEAAVNTNTDEINANAGAVLNLGSDITNLTTYVGDSPQVAYTNASAIARSEERRVGKEC